MPEEDPPKRVAFLPPKVFNVERVFPIRNLVATTREDTSPGPKHDGRSSVLSGSVVRVNGSLASAETEAPPSDGTVPSTTAVASELGGPANLEASQSGDTSGHNQEFQLQFASSTEESASQKHTASRRPTTDRSQLIPNISGPPGVLLLTGLTSSSKGRHFYRCEDEPIHTPGAIQTFGVLVASRYNTDKNLEVRIVSENSASLLDYTPDELFSLASFVDIFAEDCREDLIERIRDALQKTFEQKGLGDTQRDIVKVGVLRPNGEQRQLWCAIHISKGTRDLVICEFEEYCPQFYLGDAYLDQGLPELPIRTVDLSFDPEERHKSTTRESQPLRVLEIARRRIGGDVPTIDIFGAMTEAQGQLGNCLSVQQVLDVVVGLVSDLTGFHRVMFYRFDSKQNGCVDA